MQGMAQGGMRFCIQHGKWATASGVFSAFSVGMSLKTVFKVFGDPCINGSVRALKDVDNPAQRIFFSLTEDAKVPECRLEILLRL